MENNIENKQKLFAQYFEQDVWNYKESNFQSIPLRATILNNVDTDDWLCLKPLSNISDEDAIALGAILGYVPNHYVEGEKHIIKLMKEEMRCYENGISTLKAQYWVTRMIDFLRSRGYAIEYMGLSVEKQVEYGWVKLIK